MRAITHNLVLCQRTTQSRAWQHMRVAYGGQAGALLPVA